MVWCIEDDQTQFEILRGQGIGNPPCRARDRPAHPLEQDPSSMGFLYRFALTVGFVDP